MRPDPLIQIWTHYSNSTKKINFDGKSGRYELVFDAGWKRDDVFTHWYFDKADLDKAFEVYERPTKEPN